ncbi:hypothetical protein GCM10029992_33350 [Glycomyces albus]
MKRRLDLDPAQPNYAWCFDCVPEENSLLLEDGDGAIVEIPALDLVFSQPEALMGERTYARFGAEFPIRFDFLDTMEGGNLSLQVHPLTDYIFQTFGMSYTQDESYYLLDAGDDAVVYLGFKDGVDPEEMLEDLRVAQTGERPFDAEKYVNTFPAEKHDHFLIPAGTVHSSGANSMVLEISATPFIFTFKLWDWGRLGLDGVPGPSTSTTARRTSPGTATGPGPRRTSSAASKRCTATTTWSRSAPDCTNWSSSRSAATGSHDRPPTTPRAPSTS